MSCKSTVLHWGWTRLTAWLEHPLGARSCYSNHRTFSSLCVADDDDEDDDDVDGGTGKRAAEDDDDEDEVKEKKKIHQIINGYN